MIRYPSVSRFSLQLAEAQLKDASKTAQACGGWPPVDCIPLESRSHMSLDWWREGAVSKTAKAFGELRLPVLSPQGVSLSPAVWLAGHRPTIGSLSSFPYGQIMAMCLCRPDALI